MAEADALGVHHPGDYVTALVAGPEAVPEILLRADHQARLMVVVKRAQPEQVRAVALEFDAARFCQALQRDLLFQPFDHFTGDAGHPTSFPALSPKTCQEGRTRFKEPS